jgi:hypothetical protein
MTLDRTSSGLEVSSTKIRAFKVDLNIVTVRPSSPRLQFTISSLNPNSP